MRCGCRALACAWKHDLLFRLSTAAAGLNDAAAGPVGLCFTCHAFYLIPLLQLDSVMRLLAYWRGPGAVVLNADWSADKAPVEQVRLLMRGAMLQRCCMPACCRTEGAELTIAVPTERTWSRGALLHALVAAGSAGRNRLMRCLPAPDRTVARCVVLVVNRLLLPCVEYCRVLRQVVSTLLTELHNTGVQVAFVKSFEAVYCFLPLMVKVLFIGQVRAGLLR